MVHEEDTSNQKQEQKKPVIRRDKVVVTKVTEQELSQIKSTAEQCGMTRSDFIRARALGYKPRQRLSDRELDGLRQLAACRTDMVNFANALHGLSDNEKIRLFRHEETMLEWYEKVAHVTNHVADFLQSAQTVNSYPAGTTNQETMPGIRRSARCCSSPLSSRTRFPRNTKTAWIWRGITFAVPMCWWSAVTVSTKP